MNDDAPPKPKRLANDDNSKDRPKASRKCPTLIEVLDSSDDGALFRPKRLANDDNLKAPQKRPIIEVLDSLDDGASSRPKRLPNDGNSKDRPKASRRRPVIVEVFDSSNDDAPSKPKRLANNVNFNKDHPKPSRKRQKNQRLFGRGCPIILPTYSPSDASQSSCHKAKQICACSQPSADEARAAQARP